MALVDALTLYTKVCVCACWRIQAGGGVGCRCAVSNAVCLCSQALHTLIALQKRYLDSIGKLTPAEEDSFWQVIIGQRVEVIRLDLCKKSIKVPREVSFCYFNVC